MARRISHRRKRLGQVFLRGPIGGRQNHATRCPHSRRDGAGNRPGPRHSHHCLGQAGDCAVRPGDRPRATPRPCGNSSPQRRTFAFCRRTRGLTITPSCRSPWWSWPICRIRRVWRFWHNCFATAIGSAASSSCCKKEVAARLLADPDSSAYSATSVFFQYHAVPAAWLRGVAACLHACTGGRFNRHHPDALRRTAVAEPRRAVLLARRQARLCPSPQTAARQPPSACPTSPSIKCSSRRRSPPLASTATHGRRSCPSPNLSSSARRCVCWRRMGRPIRARAAATACRAGPSGCSPER